MTSNSSLFSKVLSVSIFFFFSFVMFNCKPVWYIIIWEWSQNIMGHCINTMYITLNKYKSLLCTTTGMSKQINDVKDYMLATTEGSSRSASGSASDCATEIQNQSINVRSYLSEGPDLLGNRKIKNQVIVVVLIPTPTSESFKLCSERYLSNAPSP